MPAQIKIGSEQLLHNQTPCIVVELVHITTAAKDTAAPKLEPPSGTPAIAYGPEVGCLHPRRSATEQYAKDLSGSGGAMPK